MKQYNVAFKAWWDYCICHQIHPYKADVPQVIAFLQFTLDSNPKLSYGTFNSFRSALSLLLPGEVGKDTRLKRYLKGIFRLRPPKRKYNYTWDPAMVLRYLGDLPNDDSLSLERLTRKLATLLALCSAHRIQTLARIKVENIIISLEKIQIPIDEHLKNSGVGIHQPCIQLPFFHENRSICVATTLLQYIERTAPLRSVQQGYLFLVTRKPYITASTQTISRWIRRTLAESGVNPMFSAYSTRHAATSAAHRNGIMLETIRKTAGWSKNSEVFARFYRCPLQTDNNLAFARSILES